MFNISVTRVFMGIFVVPVLWCVCFLSCARSRAPSRCPGGVFGGAGPSVVLLSLSQQGRPRADMLGRTGFFPCNNNLLFTTNKLLRMVTLLNPVV